MNESQSGVSFLSTNYIYSMDFTTFELIFKILGKVKQSATVCNILHVI